MKCLVCGEDTNGTVNGYQCCLSCYESDDPKVVEKITGFCNSVEIKNV